RCGDPPLACEVLDGGGMNAGAPPEGGELPIIWDDSFRMKGTAKPYPNKKHIGPIDPDASALNQILILDSVKAPTLMVVLKKEHTGPHCFDCTPFAPETPNRGKTYRNWDPIDLYLLWFGRFDLLQEVNREL